jgi:3-deoxy-D-manno-octulosonic-acid transferase
VEGEVRKILNLQPYQHVFVAGSTREGEEETVLDVYETVLKHFPDMVLIIAPRHIIRTAAIGSLLKSRGLEYQLRTELKAGGPVRKAPVIIMNTFGELFRFYSVGTINFCGASLVPLGGQNPLEAAVWSKVVFYGPHMEDFLDAKALLEKEGAGIEVSNVQSFAEKAIWVLSHPDSAKHHGMKAKDAILRNQGAAEKHAKVVVLAQGVEALEVSFRNNHDPPGGYGEVFAVFIWVVSDFSVGRQHIVLINDGFLDFAVSPHNHIVHDHRLIDGCPTSNHHVMGEH